MADEEPTPEQAIEAMVSVLEETGYVAVADLERRAVDVRVMDGDRLLGALLLVIGRWSPERRGWFMVVPARLGIEVSDGSQFRAIGPIAHDPRGAIPLIRSELSLLPTIPHTSLICRDPWIMASDMD
ncbi:hypothetical protein [Marinactinospora rubrisoli]|uniref:Immunity protein 35 domain-containing protein n=1 Tax=Marinactinospora rubrisoli TaxID=2715399 RepID=A0ABW2KNJ6_9ACTN